MKDYSSPDCYSAIVTLAIIHVYASIKFSSIIFGSYDAGSYSRTSIKTTKIIQKKWGFFWDKNAKVLHPIGSNLLNMFYFIT